MELSPFQDSGAFEFFSDVVNGAVKISTWAASLNSSLSFRQHTEHHNTKSPVSTAGATDRRNILFLMNKEGVLKMKYRTYTRYSEEQNVIGVKELT